MPPSPHPFARLSKAKSILLLQRLTKREINDLSPEKRYKVQSLTSTGHASFAVRTVTVPKISWLRSLLSSNRTHLKHTHFHQSLLGYRSYHSCNSYNSFHVIVLKLCVKLHKSYCCPELLLTVYSCKQLPP